VKRYGTKMCQGCPLRSKCTTSAVGGNQKMQNMKNKTRLGLGMALGIAIGTAIGVALGAGIGHNHSEVEFSMVKS